MSRIYPEIEPIHKPETTSRRLSNLENNCNQVFVKGPAITREFFHKVQTEVSAQQIDLFGYECKTKHIWVSVGLLFLFLFSVTGTVLMWCTESFDKALLSNLVLKNNSDAYDRFKNPMANALVKVHIFNYTNLERYENGLDEKLMVKDVGPYVYEETLTRVNTVFNANGTISFQEKRGYKYRPDKSKGRKQMDRLIVPNFNLISVGSVAKNFNYFGRAALSALLQTMNIEPFLELSAHKFIFGYDDPLYTLARGYLALTGLALNDKFGLLSLRNGTSNDIFTINTGVNDVNKLGLMERQNGEESLNHWSTEECNSIVGTDGTLFPPTLVREKRTLFTYYKDLCRRVALQFEKEVKIFNGTIDAYRYSVPTSIYNHPDNLPENQCYCNMDTGECPPQGFFNTTPCAFGAPAFVSFPHFYMGDPEISKSIVGMKPNPKLHQTYINVNPKLGFAMSGNSRIQLNIQVKKSFGFNQLNTFKKDIMLPIAWFDIGLNDQDIPKDVYDYMYNVILLVDGLELALKYGFLLTSIVTLACLLIVIKTKLSKQILNTLERTESGQRRLIL